MANIPTQTGRLVDPDGRVMPAWWAWLTGLTGGYTGTVDLAKLTGAGTNGSLTVKNGIIISYTAPT